MDLQSLVPVAHFDTDLIEPDLRLEAWHENMGVLFDLSAPDGEKQDHRIYSQIKVCSFGDTVFGTTKANSQLFKRGAGKIARDDMDHILLQVFLQGGGVTAAGEKFSAGDMLVIDLNQPHQMLNTDFENLTLVLPVDLHPELSNTLSPLHGKRLASHNPVVRLMAEHLFSLWKNIPDMAIAQASGTLHDSLSLLHGCFSRENMAIEHESGAATELGRLVRRHIESHLADGLTPDTIADTFNISRSQLYRMFADHDGVSRFIWQRRLHRAMRMLSQPQFRHLPIIAVANECGFASEAHFSRVFRTHFGRPPGQARREAQEMKPEALETGVVERAYRTDLADWIRQL